MCVVCVSHPRLAPRRRPKRRHHALGEEPQALHGLLVSIGGRIMEQERGQPGLVAERTEPRDHATSTWPHAGFWSRGAGASGTCAR